jgi:hypothetical protein
MPKFEPRDPDFDARVRNSFNRQNVMRTMGITIAVRVAMPVFR